MMRGMRVLFTTFGFPTRSHSFVENYVLALTALGTDVCVVASADGDHALKVNGAESGAGSLTIIRTSRSGPGAKKLLTLLRASSAAAALHPGELRALVSATRRRHGIGREFLKSLYTVAPILSWRADVVHLGWLKAATEWMGLLPELDVPVVVSCRGSDLRIDPLVDSRYRQRISVVFDRVDAVHCVSEELARRAISLGLDPSKVFVGSWGVDTQFFSPAPAPDTNAPPARLAGRTLRIVSVGRLHWVKGHEYALMALHQVRRTGLEVEYTIIGDAGATARASVLTAIRDLDLEGSVLVRDELSRVEVREALRRADVFLHPSVSEGLSNATLEAMAVGVPVVVTDVGGMRELVTDGIDGFVVPSRDPAALAAALLDLAADSELRAKMGERGRQRVVDDFDAESRTVAMLEQYRRLVREHVGACARRTQS
jgi:colanic acid/amylovoran biosynthesis glycosyltransferase